MCIESYKFHIFVTGNIINIITRGGLASLTNWDRVTHICVSKLTIIGSDNSLSPDRRQAIIWTNVGLLLIGALGTNFSEILIEILTFSFKKMRLKVSSAKWRPFCLGLNVLNGVTELGHLHHLNRCCRKFKIWIKMRPLSLWQMCLKMSSAKWQELYTRSCFIRHSFVGFFLVDFIVILNKIPRAGVAVLKDMHRYDNTWIHSQIARFVWPTWGPPASWWPHESCYRGWELIW